MKLISSAEIDMKYKELMSLNTANRRIAIFTDINEKTNYFKVLADEDPSILFKILDGDEFGFIYQNWAIPYNYSQYISDNDLVYSVTVETSWDLEMESIQNAENTGYWIVTAISTIQIEGGGEITFEFEYDDGYQSAIITTPYEELIDHGFSF
jgi:hypothetical protein